MYYIIWKKSLFSYEIHNLNILVRSQDLISANKNIFHLSYKKNEQQNI